MKLIVFIIHLFLYPIITNGQCEDISFLIQLFNENLEKQDQMLDTKGFTINQDNGYQFGMDWVNIKYNQYISIRRNESNTVDRVQYRLLGSSECYNDLKNKLPIIGFKKQYETIGSYSTFYFFYKSENFGVILSKWKAPDSYVGNFYSIEIHNLESYYMELEKRK